MTRDWEAEWVALLAGERAALQAMIELNPTVSGQRAMSDEAGRLYREAVDLWKQRRRELEAFFDEWRAEPSFYGVPRSE